MKWILFCLFLPLYSFSQTVHIDDDEIVYKGSINQSTGNTNNQQSLSTRLSDAINKIEGKELKSDNGKTTVEIKLRTPYYLIRKTSFDVSLNQTDSSIKYELNNFIIEETIRGKESKTIASKKIVKDMGESGIPSIEAEKILNQIDMRIQEFIALLKYPAIQGK